MSPSEDSPTAIHPILAGRWSPLAFADTPVDEQAVRTCFEAARWAPSSFNEQPWRFLYSRHGTPLYDQLFSCLAEANQVWVAAAPVLILSCARLHFSHNNKPNPHAIHDVGLATASFVFQAEALGMRARLIAGFSARRASELLRIPQDYQPVSMLALGFLGDSRVLPDNLQQRQQAPRSRMDQDDFVLTESWS